MKQSVMGGQNGLPSTPDTRDAVRLVKMQIKNTVKMIKKDQK